MWPSTVRLVGNYAALELLDQKHEQDLRESVEDGQLYELWYTTVPNADGIRLEIERRLALREVGSMFPFAVIEQSSTKAVGMTTYMNIDALNKRVEIGSTWYRKAIQRTPINTECKLLLMTHAFEELNCIAVEFRTHVMNQKSRQSIERLGAKLDGILRSHSILENGTMRDTAVYSVIESEWPAVKVNLQHKLVNLMPRRA